MHSGRFARHLDGSYAAVTEPSASQTVATLAEEKGESAVAWAAVRRYWKPVSAVLAAVLALGKIIQQGEDAKEKLVKIEAAQTTQAAQNSAVNDRLTHLEADWGALFSASKITVTPNVPEVQVNAPQEARKGKVKR